jgi:hypothetical protein
MDCISELPLIMLISSIRNDVLLAVVLAICSCGLVYFVVLTSRRRLPYPPGPRGLPIVGNSFSMPSREEWVTYWKWSKDCGMGRSPPSFTTER